MIDSLRASTTQSTRVTSPSARHPLRRMPGSTRGVQNAPPTGYGEPFVKGYA